MKVVNLHERKLQASVVKVGELLDTLSSPHDQLWPRRQWPAMRLDRPLGIGADGGHGPIRYVVEDYAPGLRVAFRFTRPAGFDGFHRLDLVPTEDGGCRLCHRIEMQTQGRAVVSWSLVYRHLHDALIEDALAQAQSVLGEPVEVRRWSWWVRMLRTLIAPGRSRAQFAAGAAQKSETDARGRRWCWARRRQHGRG